MGGKKKVGVALRVMLLTMDHSIIRALRRAPDYETPQDALDDEIEIVKDHKQGPVVGAHGVNGEDEKEVPEGEEGEGMDPALLNAMLEAAGDDDDMRY